MTKAGDMFEKLNVVEELFSDRIRHLASKGLREGNLTKEDQQTLAGSVMKHLEDFDHKRGIFKNLKTP